MKKRANSSLSPLLLQSLSLLFMALLAFLPDPEAKTHPPAANPKRKKKQQKTKHPASASSWDQVKSLLTCKQIEESQIHHPIYASSCSSICTFRDVTRVVHRSDNISPDSTSLGQEITRLLSKKNSHGSSSTTRSINSSSLRSVYGAGAYAGKGIQLRRLSGCYECHPIVDPSMYPLPRTRICACSECGEVFPKVESLEHHQAIRHAVSELGPDDSSRHIVEIIFKSSWLKKDSPICKIERILKVHNTQRTIQRFEDYRNAVKTRANFNSNSKRNARCAADGNELLRFHCATITCPLGARGSSSSCPSVPGCGVCTIIRHGFQGSKISGVHTTASSGGAHDSIGVLASRRAMLVCRVIAGRVKRVGDEAAAGEEDGAAAPVAGSFDSVSGFTGIYSNLEDLYVFNSRAILPCFVVIYKALECSTN